MTGPRHEVLASAFSLFSKVWFLIFGQNRALASPNLVIFHF